MNGEACARAIIEEQIPIIKRMIEDECWYEGERRNSPVKPDDPAIKKRVAELVMAHGAQMRLEAMERLEKKNVKS